MALTKAYTAMTWASGSATTTGVTNAVDLTASYAHGLYMQFVISGGSATVAAIVTVNIAGDGTNYRSSLGPFTMPLAAGTYNLPPIQLPSEAESVKVTYTQQTTNTGTLTIDVGRLTAL